MSSLDLTTRTDPFLEAVNRTAVFAFQPIVNINTGACYGFEALLRNVDKIGFSSINDFFDYAWNTGILHRVDMMLRRIAISQFANTPASEGRKLFFNIDGRIFESQDYHPHQTVKIMNQHGVSPDRLILELPEGYNNDGARHLGETLRICREHGYKIAIDDFGRGFSELKMLYEHQPDYVKIDRFFINGLADDTKRRIFVSSIVNLAHVLGATVVAEGVETEREFLAAKEIGCDLVQGFFVAKPTIDHETLLSAYPIVKETNRRDRRKRKNDRFLIGDHITRIATLRQDDDLNAVFDAFRDHKTQTIFPVLDDDNRPVGVVREEDLKGFIYIKYGRDLLQNKVIGKTLRDFITRCPYADILTEAEKILETYSISEHADGIIITEDFRYSGFLTADSLLRILNEKNLNLARDQNPVTKLPGNNSVMDHVSKSLEQNTVNRSLVYFDFNNFKPFNDTYGFRQGDRAITMFGDILRRETMGMDVFLGHIGGDDFFLGFENASPVDVYVHVSRIQRMFSEDAASLYSKKDRTLGYIEAADRKGEMTRFPLLNVCAAVLNLLKNTDPDSNDLVMTKLSELKKKAKSEDGFIAMDTIPVADDAKPNTIQVGLDTVGNDDTRDSSSLTLDQMDKALSNIA